MFKTWNEICCSDKIELIQVHSFRINTDANSVFQKLRTYIDSIRNEYENVNYLLFQHLSSELESLPDHIIQRNFPQYAKDEHMILEGNNIKITPLSPQCTQVSIRQENNSNKDIFDELVRNIEAHPFFGGKERQQTLEPKLNAPIKEWFQYLSDNPQTRISLKNIAAKKHLSYGYVRQLHSQWVRSTVPRRPSKS